MTKIAASIGLVNVLMSFAGAQNSLAGLDQINLSLPREPAGRGTLTADGKAANFVKVWIKRRRHSAASGAESSTKLSLLAA